MERIGIRELRNETSRVVRRVRAGERLIVTIDGIPAAQLVPLDDPSRPRTMEELIATGEVLPAQTRTPPPPPDPLPAPPGPSTTEILGEHRRR